MDQWKLDQAAISTPIYSSDLDGNQILFIDVKQSPSTVEARLQTGESMISYGTSREHAAFDGSVLSEIRLTSDPVAIFRIDP